MANRVTLAEVDEIFERDATVVTDLQAVAFMNLANMVVTVNLVDDEDLTVVFADLELKEIERWLSAHFMAMKDRRVSSESAGGVSASYVGSYGLGLDGSTYGQQVKMLDRSGSLALLGAIRKIATMNTLSPQSSTGLADEV